MNWGFASSHGNELTRCWPGTEQQARAKAQLLANERNDTIEFWLEPNATKAEAVKPMSALKGAQWLGRLEARRRALSTYSVGEELELAHKLRFGDRDEDLAWRSAFARAYRGEIERRQMAVST